MRPGWPPKRACGRSVRRPRRFENFCSTKIAWICDFLWSFFDSFFAKKEYLQYWQKISPALQKTARGNRYNKQKDKAREVWGLSNEEFTGLMQQYQRLIYTVCLQFVHDPHTAEDLTQDTFLAAFSAIDRCEPQY